MVASQPLLVELPDELSGPRVLLRPYREDDAAELTRLAFDRLAANRVEIRMDVRNTRSRAIPVRLGFVFEGCLRRAMPDIRGQPGDIDVFALIRDDYDRLSWHTPA